MHLSADGEWQWDPESVKPGEVVLGPSFRTMTPYTATEGVRVFVDVHDGSLLCKHGELGSTIGTWLQLERAPGAREDAAPALKHLRLPIGPWAADQASQGGQPGPGNEQGGDAPATGAGEAHAPSSGTLRH